VRFPKQNFWHPSPLAVFTHSCIEQLYQKIAGNFEENRKAVLDRHNCWQGENIAGGKKVGSQECDVKKYWNSNNLESCQNFKVIQPKTYSTCLDILGFAGIQTHRDHREIGNTKSWNIWNPNSKESYPEGHQNYKIVVVHITTPQRTPNVPSKVALSHRGQTTKSGTQRTPQ